MNELIREASGAQDYAAFAQLIGEYVDWLRSRYDGDRGVITEVLDRQALARELESLPATYGPPNGRAFVAVRDGEVCGCGAYRRLEQGACEMKRVFVPPRFQGAGLGRLLCAALIAAARADGFVLMKLDTGRRMTEAANLYRSLGFRECLPYLDYPEPLLPHFVFMERPLAGAGGAPDDGGTG